LSSGAIDGPRLIHKLVKPGKGIPSCRANQIPISKALIPQAEAKMGTAQTTVLRKSNAAVGRDDRLSCHRFRANAFRLLLHSFAYNLVNLFCLHLPSSMRSAQIETLRTQLFKIGARIRQTARCVRVHLASGWPFQDLFQAASACNSS
jgi:hypothetical protein